MKDVNNNDVVLNQNQMKKEILNLTNKLDVQELVYSKTLSKYEKKLTLLSFNVSQQNSKIENIEKEKNNSQSAFDKIQVEFQKTIDINRDLKEVYQKEQYSRKLQEKIDNEKYQNLWQKYCCLEDKFNERQIIQQNEHNHIINEQKNQSNINKDFREKFNFSEFEQSNLKKILSSNITNIKEEFLNEFQKLEEKYNNIILEFSLRQTKKLGLKSKKTKQIKELKKLNNQMFLKQNELITNHSKMFDRIEGKMMELELNLTGDKIMNFLQKNKKKNEIQLNKDEVNEKETKTLIINNNYNTEIIIPTDTRNILMPQKNMFIKNYLNNDSFSIEDINNNKREKELENYKQEKIKIKEKMNEKSFPMDTNLCIGKNSLKINRKIIPDDNLLENKKINIGKNIPEYEKQKEIIPNNNLLENKKNQC